MTIATTTTGRAAAEELAAKLPTTVPLRVAEFDPASAPASHVPSVRAHFVGSTSADLVLVADDAIAAVLEGAGDDVSAADALRPALEAAAATLGALTDPDVEVFALVGDDGVAQAWFGIRIRVIAANPQAAPKPMMMDAATERARMRLLHDVELVLTAEIGHTRLPMHQVLDLVPGTVLELDRAAGSPADVMVNGRLVARGEVVVVDEDYGIRITEIISSESGQ